MPHQQPLTYTIEEYNALNAARYHIHEIDKRDESYAAIGWAGDLASASTLFQELAAEMIVGVQPNLTIAQMMAKLPQYEHKYLRIWDTALGRYLDHKETRLGH